MSLILCRQEPVKTPYYFESLGVRIYSSQELCYVIYNNPLLVMEGFIDKTLIAFIRNELDMEFLAAKLEKWQQSGENEEGLLAVILQECGYYHGAEINRFRQQVAGLKKLPPHEFLKEKADCLFSRRLYGKAVKEYQRLLELPASTGMEDGFLARVYNNLGASYARLFMTGRAYQAYQKSFDLAKNSEVLKRICYLALWKPELPISERFQALLTEELKQECSRELKRAEEEAGKAKSLQELDELFLKDPIKRLGGAGELVQKWKTQYRNIMS